MTLQIKITTIIAALILLLGAVYHVIERIIILPGYLSLENQLAEKDMDRCRAAIEAEIRHLDNLVNDWAAWDDTYRFVIDRNTQYMRSNLIDDTFIDNRLNLIFYFDPQGIGVWGRGFDLDAGRSMTLPPFDKTRLDPSHPLLHYSSVKSRHAGLMLTPQGAMMFSCRPVLTSNNKGPIRGSLLMGRLISQTDREALIEQTGVQHHFWAVNSENMPPDARSALMTLSQSRPVVSVVKGNHRLMAYQAMPDYQGRPALLIRCDIPRTILTGGLTSLHIARISFLAALILMLVAMMVALQRIIVSPISHLKAHTGRIRRTHDLSLRSGLHGRDEIGRLAGEIDRMVEKLECYHARLRSLSTRLLQTEAQERRKLAAYLHDQIVQSMTIAKIKLDELVQNTVDEKTVESIDHIGGLVEKSIQRARTMTFELSPQVLYELGLAPAMDWLADRFSREHKLAVRVTHDGLNTPIEDKLSSFLFQATREFLVNIVKHGHTGEADVRLTADAGWVTLTVEDKGVGLAAGQPSTPEADSANSGFGLFTIGETVRHLGGTLTVRPGADGGTRAVLTMPVDACYPPIEKGSLA